MNELKYNKYFVYIFGGLLFLSVLGLATLVATDPGDNLVLKNNEFRILESGSRVAAGIVENKTGRSFSDVMVEIEFLNEQGEIVDTRALTTNAIEGGMLWQFELPVIRKDVVDFNTKISSPENVRPEWLGGCTTTIC